MNVEVADAVRRLESLGILERSHTDDSARIIAHVREQIGQAIPKDLDDFYRERILRIGEFHAIAPIWNDHVGWRPMVVDITALLHVNAVPIFFDGSGNLFGLDLGEEKDRVPAVYFFDHADGFGRPRWAAGSSLGAFLLLLAESDRALRNGRPARWELSIDPDIDKCPRAPPIWAAG